MIGNSIRKLEMIGHENESAYLVEGKTKIMNDALVSARTKGVVKEDPNFSNTDSARLLREVDVVLYNDTGDNFRFRKSKMSISGSKYIGIQQDMFVIALYNIDIPSLAIAINKRYITIQVRLEDKTVFAGTIKNINTGRENIVTEVVELYCLNKVTELLADMVSPITVDSSMNIWNILRSVEPNLPDSAPKELKNIKFEEELTLSGSKRNVIENIIQIYNDQLKRLNIKDLPWIDYEYNQEGTLNIFSPNTITEVLNLEPRTGLIGTPRIGEGEIQFDAIYKYKLVPGRVVKLNNAFFSTLGGETAYVYAWDPQGLYVITEVKVSLNTYPHKFNVSCKARPLSKYNNFVTTRGS